MQSVSDYAYCFDQLFPIMLSLKGDFQMPLQTLSRSEYPALLSYLGNLDSRDSLIVRILLQCGLRPGELCALNIDSIWRQGHIHPAIFLPGSACKSNRSRHVDMPPPVLAALDRHIARLLIASYPCIPGAPLFFSFRRRIRLSIRDIHNITASITTLAIGRQVNPRCLRHTYATILLRYTNIRVVQQLLGHAFISTTQIYTHPDSDDRKTAVDAAFS